MQISSARYLPGTAGVDPYCADGLGKRGSDCEVGLQCCSSLAGRPSPASRNLT